MKKVYGCPNCARDLVWVREGKKGYGAHYNADNGDRHRCDPSVANIKAHAPSRNPDADFVRGLLHEAKSLKVELPIAETREGKTTIGVNYKPCTREHSTPPWERCGCECEFA